MPLRSCANEISDDHASYGGLVIRPSTFVRDRHFVLIDEEFKKAPCPKMALSKPSWQPYGVGNLVGWRACLEGSEVWV